MAAYCPHCMFPTDTPYCPNCGQSTSWQPGEGQLHAGTVLNGSGLHRYMTGAAIGQGGFGITYIAVDMDSGERVAVKECFPTQCAQRGVNGVAVEARSGFEQTLQGALESFLDEARLLARQGALASIVQVRDFFRANGTAYLVMEYLDGVTLKNMMCTGGVIPAQELLRRLRPLIGDLGRLHASGVIHRDISPDNLMWMPSGGIKLLDFGCARSMENGKSMSVQLKHGFAPVEQYQTRGQGPWTDIYALCATIYYCTTGRLPTPAVERLEGGELTAPTALGSDLTPRQEAALLWGMEVQPARRPQAMEDLAAALYADPAEDGGRESGRRREKTGGNGYTPPGEEKKRDVRSGGLPARTRRIAAIAAAAAAVAVIAIVLAVSGLFGGDDRDVGAPVQPAVTGAPGLSLAPSAVPSAVPSPTPEPTPTPVVPDGVTEDGYEYVLGGDSATVVGYTGNETALAPPEEIEGLPVRAIGEGAFSGNSYAEQLILPEGLEEIGAEAFAGCTSLTCVVVFSDAQVAEGAFSGCPVRAVQQMESGYVTETELYDIWGLEGDVRVFTFGEDTGDGSLVLVYVDDAGIVYALADSSNAVIMDFPNDADEIVPQTSVSEFPVTWINENAADGLDGVPDYWLRGDILFPQELMYSLEMDIYEDADGVSLSASWFMSNALAILMDEVRAEDGVTEAIAPNEALTRACMARAAELTESFTSERPDGSDWGDALREYEVDWANAWQFIRSFGSDEDGEALGEYLLEVAQQFAAYDEDISGYYDGVGVAMSVGEDGTYYICCIATAA